jgi:hypothetical protein
MTTKYLAESVETVGPLRYDESMKERGYIMCSQEVHTIGFVKSAAILSRRGNKLAPEQVARPLRFGEPRRLEYAGCGASGGWSYQELFPHVKSQGYTNPRMI